MANPKATGVPIKCLIFLLNRGVIFMLRYLCWWRAKENSRISPKSTPSAQIRVHLARTKDVDLCKSPDLFERGRAGPFGSRSRRRGNFDLPLSSRRLAQWEGKPHRKAAMGAELGWFHQAMVSLGQPAQDRPISLLRVNGPIVRRAIL